MGIATFSQGFAGGVSIRGVPLVQTHPGKAFWVSNKTTGLTSNEKSGSDGNNGSYLAPFASLNYAITQCTANRGDIIFIKPGHVETVSSSTALTLGVAQVAVIGLGNGSTRPKFTLDTANTSTVNITAADIMIHNVQFVANFLNIASCFTLGNAPGFNLNNVELKDTSSVLNFVAGVTTSTTSNQADSLTLTSVDMFGLGTGTNTTLISMLGTNDRVTVSGCYTQNKATTDGGGVMIIATGKIVTNLKMFSNMFNLTGTSAATAGIMITTNGSTNTGMLSGNVIQGLDATSEILVTASSGFTFFNNLYSGAADKSGYLLPAADA